MSGGHAEHHGDESVPKLLAGITERLLKVPFQAIKDVVDIVKSGVHAIFPSMKTGGHPEAGHPPAANDHPEKQGFGRSFWELLKKPFVTVKNKAISVGKKVLDLHSRFWNSVSNGFSALLDWVTKSPDNSQKSHHEEKSSSHPEHDQHSESHHDAHEHKKAA